MEMLVVFNVPMTHVPLTHSCLPSPNLMIQEALAFPLALALGLAGSCRLLGFEALV